jgi:hypothetical protein
VITCFARVILLWKACSAAELLLLTMVRCQQAFRCAFLAVTLPKFLFSY